MREKGQTEAAKTLETPVFSRGIEILTEKIEFIEYHMEFFRAGITQIIKLWLKNGCKESPEDMVEIIKSEYRGRDSLSAGQSAK